MNCRNCGIELECIACSVKDSYKGYCGNCHVIRNRMMKKIRELITEMTMTGLSAKEAAGQLREHARKENWKLLSKNIEDELAKRAGTQGDY